MGKLLVSGDGKGNSAILAYWTKISIIGVIIIVIMYSLATSFDKPPSGYVDFGRDRREFASNILKGCCILTIIGVAYEGIATQSKITKTEISVYEQGVKGKSLPFKFVHTHMSDFQLNYDQISSVDLINGRCIVIHATGVQHKCYAMNASEIRDVIMRQKYPGNQ